MTQQPPFGNVSVGVNDTPTGLDAIALGARLCSPRRTSHARQYRPHDVADLSQLFRHPGLDARGARCSNASARQSAWSPS